MYIEQIYTNCLAQASYYIESEGYAAIVDPMRDVDVYLQLAAKRNAKIKYVFNTHFHADFVSGHLDIAAKTGAIVVFGSGAKPKYKAFIADDGENFVLGDIKIEALHTPGHTIESTCFLAYDEKNHPNALFSGDTLFIGDVGRPDLLSGNLSKEVLGAMLYNSITKKIKPLADDIIVYPGHGAGSACGKNLSKETKSTMGEQKKFNYALGNLTEAEFIHLVTTDQPPVPAYFFKDAQININGHTNLDSVYAKAMKALSSEQATDAIKNGATILDTRSASEFAEGFIAGAINIDLNGQFAIWVGTLINIEEPLLIVATAGKEKEVITRLARIGFENVLGYINDFSKGNFNIDKIQLIAAEEIEASTKGNFILLDVRNPTEVSKEKIKGSVHIPLNELNQRLTEIDKNKTIVVYCVSGYRSMIASSILRKNGFAKVLNITGGINQTKSLHPELIEFA